MIINFKIFEGLYEVIYFLFPVNENVCKSHYEKLIKYNPKIFILNKTECIKHNFSTDLQDYNIAIRYNKNFNAPRYYKARSYHINNSELSILEKEIKIEDLDLYISTNKYNL